MKQFKEESSKLRERLFLGGYSKKTIRIAYKKVIIQDRNSILYKRKPMKDENTHTRVITNYNTQYQDVHNIRDILVHSKFKI